MIDKFTAHIKQTKTSICCLIVGLMTGWVKMPIGRLRMQASAQAAYVLDGDTSPLLKTMAEGSSPLIFDPCIVTKQLDGSRCHLIRR